MAKSDALVDWNSNTEPDLAGYIVSYGLYPGLYTHTVGLNNGTPTPPSQALVTTFNSDGLWYFAVHAFDTSLNASAKTSAVSKRITQVQSKLRHRR
jgi:hypothetical protein